MAKIPRGKEASPGGIGGVSQVPVLNQADKAIGKVAQNISDFAGNLLAKRAESATRSYASNTYSRDLIDTNDFVTKLQLNTPANGAGFSDSVKSFLDNRLEQRQKDAPSDEAYQLYASKFNQLRTRTVINASSVESQMATKSARTDRELLLEEFAGKQVLATNITSALEYARTQEADIMGEVGLHYSPVDAATSIKKMKSKISKSIFDGLDASSQPERSLGILRSVVSEKIFNESLSAEGYDPNSIPPEDPAIGDLVGEGLTSGEKARRLKGALTALKQKHKNSVIADTAELRDLSLKFATSGSSPALSANKELLFTRAKRNTTLSAVKTLKVMDDTGLSEALGNATRRVLEKPLDQRSNINEVLQEEIAEQREALKVELDSMVDLGYPKEQLQEAARQLSNPHYNTSKIAQITSAFNKAVKTSTTKLITQGAEYFNNTSNEVALAGQAIMEPGSTPEERAGAFSHYAKTLDVRYEAFGLNTDERKYLTPAMHRFYGRELNNPESAARGLDALYGIQQELGDKAKTVFNELVKSKTITEDMYAVSTVDPRYSEQLEPIYAMALDPGRIDKIKKQINFTESQGKDLKNDITDKLKDMRAALASADPSGGNIDITIGLQNLYTTAVINDMAKMSQSEAIKKWEKVFTYPIAKSGESNLIVQRDMEHELPNVEDFINEFDNQRSLDTLHKKMGITVDPFDSPIRINGESLPVERVRGLVEAGHGDLVKRFYKDMVNDQSEWVMAPDGVSAMEVLKDADGVIRPRRDSNGQKIIVPYEKMKEFTVDDFTPQQFGEFGRFGDYDDDGNLKIPKSLKQIEAEEDAANKALEEGGSIDPFRVASTTDDIAKKELANTVETKVGRRISKFKRTKESFKENLENEDIVTSVIETASSKNKAFKSELLDRPRILKQIAADFIRLSNEAGVDPVITRVTDPIAGSSGVHEQGRGVDFRIVSQQSGKNIYTDKQIRNITTALNKKYARNDKFKTITAHRFKKEDGTLGVLHFHIQQAPSESKYK